MAESDTETKKPAARKAPAKKAAAKKPAAKKPARPRRSAKSRAVEKVARDYFEALGNHDVEAATGLMAPGVIEDVVPVGVFRGPAEVKAFFAELFAAVPDFWFAIERVVADDGRAAVEYRMGGTFTGAPFQGIEPTGKEIELRGFDLLEIEEEKIKANTGYYDGAAFARAVGLLPPQDSGAEKAMTGAFNLVTRARRAVSERRSQ